MASRANWGAIALNLFGSAGKGYWDAKKQDEETKRLAAEALLKKQKEEQDNDLKQREFQLKVKQAEAGSTTIGADGKIYQTSGIPKEFSSRISLPGMMGPMEKSAEPSLLPGAVNVGTGKFSVQKPPAENKKIIEINIPESDFNADPERYRQAPEGHKYNIVKSSKKTLSPEQQTSLFITKELYKKFLHDGSLSETQAQNLEQASKNLDVSLLTEEDQGVLYGAQKIFTGAQYQPKVDGADKVLSEDQARQYLKQANGDKNKARELAKKAGYKVK